MRPGSLDYVYWKLTSTTDLEYDTDLSSAAVRWLEWKNIVAHLVDKRTLLWGEGLGGWFTDKYYPFSAWLLGGSSYPDEWILQGRLYKPHGTQLFVLLKMGVLGIILYFGTLLLLFLHSVRIFRRLNTIDFKYITLGIVAFTPFLLYKNYISKLQVFMGICLGIIAAIEALQWSSRREKSGVEGESSVH
jgi:hypothetical protein